MLSQSSPSARPPRVVALGTSSERCSVAVCWPAHESTAAIELSDEQCVGNGHAERLLPMLEALAARAGVALREADLIAFDSGPGAFTSLRIGCGIAQGLGFALGVPLAPVCALDAVADVLGARGPILVFTDARMNEVYWAGYGSGDGRSPQRRTIGPRVDSAQIALPEALRWLAGEAASSAHGGAALAAGDGLARHPALADGLRAAGCSLDPQRWPSALGIARLGVHAYRLGQAVAAADAAPIYVRDKVALDSAEQAALRSARSAPPSTHPAPRGIG